MVANAENASTSATIDDRRYAASSPPATATAPAMTSTGWSSTRRPRATRPRPNKQATDHDLLRDAAEAVPGETDCLHHEPQHECGDQGHHEGDHDDVGPGGVAEQEELRGATEHVEQRLGDGEAGEPEDLGEAAQPSPGARSSAHGHDVALGYHRSPTPLDRPFW